MELIKVWQMFGEDHMPYRLLLLSRMIDRETQKSLMEEFGLSLAEWRLLAIACALETCTASEIGAAGDIDRAEISRAMRKLEPAGLVERSPDPNHGKRMIISPTASGKALAQKVRAQRRAFYSGIMRRLSREERREFDRQLAIMAQDTLELTSAENAKTA